MKSEENKQREKTLWFYFGTLQKKKKFFFNSRCSSWIIKSHTCDHKRCFGWYIPTFSFIVNDSFVLQMTITWYFIHHDSAHIWLQSHRKMIRAFCRATHFPENDDSLCQRKVCLSYIPLQMSLMIRLLLIIQSCLLFFPFSQFYYLFRHLHFINRSQ
jgi:hypothetical protein